MVGGQTLATFSQNNSPLQVFTPLPEGTLLATRLSGREEMGDTYRFTVSLIAQTGTQINISSLVGAFAAVQLTLPGGVQRAYHGVIWEFWQEDSDSLFDRYTMVLRPRTALLELVKRSRVFQGQAANQILQALLQPLNTPDGWQSQNLVTPLPERVYCTQYRETDLQFLRRLCSESGVTYFWSHTTSNHCITLTDNTSIHAVPLGNVPYKPQSGGTADGVVITSWRLGQKVSPAGVQVLGSQYQIFNQELQSTCPVPVSVQAGTLNLNTVQGIAPWQQDELSASRFFDSVTPSGGDNPNAITSIYTTQTSQSEVGARAAAASSVRAFAKGNCCQLTPGHSFRLTGHPNQDGEWLVLAAEHTVEVEGRFWAGEPSALKADVQAECVPLSVRQAIWPLLPRPAIAGVLTGIVIGPQGNEMFIDKYGRVQVRFWWDRDNSTSSCWIRVAQSWAGNGWGACFWPRVGHEVVVAFENGDPDRPIVVGSVYNSTNMPPYALPSNQYIAGWKSLTQGGDPSKNFHQIFMSDESDAAVVHIHAESMFIANQEAQQVTQRPVLSIDQQG
jgi:type VI secretion system secreted protein VgrG